MIFIIKCFKRGRKVTIKRYSKFKDAFNAMKEIAGKGYRVTINVYK